MSSPGQSAPTLAGFQTFIASVMGIPTNVLPTDAPIIPIVYQVALNTVNPVLAYVPQGQVVVPGTPGVYAWAVYNLAADRLINYAPDQTGEEYFAGLRKNYNINSFALGVVESASDVSTSVDLKVIEAASNFTLSDLQEMKTVYGRAYLAIAMKFGGQMWGVT